jgi:hypothetical protein
MIEEDLSRKVVSQHRKSKRKRNHDTRTLGATSFNLCGRDIYGSHYVVIDTIFDFSAM